VALDGANHRLFVADQRNGRVTVYNLDPEGGPAQTYAVHVLGKRTHLSRYTAFEEASERLLLHTLGGVSYDHVHQRLFVVEVPSGGINRAWRILVFDAAPDRLEDGAAAIAVLGQPDFRTREVGIGKNRFASLRGHVLDETHQRLFVSDGGNNRVLVFDVSPKALKNGTDAYAVLGQSDFTSNSEGLGPDKLRSPSSLVLDDVHLRLFVADSGNNRILLFDATPDRLKNGAKAMGVLGQPDFHSRRPREKPNQIAPGGMSLDTKYQRLFITDSWAGEHHTRVRILVFDVSPERWTNEPEAIAVIGQPNSSSFQTVTPGVLAGDFHLLSSRSQYVNFSFHGLLLRIHEDNLRVIPVSDHHSGQNQCILFMRFFL